MLERTPLRGSAPLQAQCGLSQTWLGPTFDRLGQNPVELDLGSRSALQKSALEPWFSNSDQASFNSMKIILAYSSYGFPAACGVTQHIY